MAKNDDVDNRKVDGVSAPGIASGDEEDAKRVREATTTRERQAVSKRAHEPLNLDDLDDEQPVEDDNGRRLPEINGAEAARVADPAVATQTDEDMTNATAKASVGKSK